MSYLESTVIDIYSIYTLKVPDVHHQQSPLTIYLRIMSLNTKNRTYLSLNPNQRHSPMPIPRLVPEDLKKSNNGPSSFDRLGQTRRVGSGILCCSST